MNVEKLNAEIPQRVTPSSRSARLRVTATWCKGFWMTTTAVMKACALLSLTAWTCSSNGHRYQIHQIHRWPCCGKRGEP